MLLSILVGLLASVLLVLAGWLLGLRRGRKERVELRALSRAFSREIVRLRERGGQVVFDDEALRGTLQSVLTPLLVRERLVLNLSRIQRDGSGVRDLSEALERIAKAGNFSAVLLSDAQGWKLASSAGTRDPDRLGATASLLVMLANRISRDGSPAPLSLVIHDSAGLTTLCRTFLAGNQRLVLTVVGAGGDITPTALDGALPALTTSLLGREKDKAVSADS